MESLTALLTVVPLWIIWPTVVAVALYWYLTREYDFWKNKGIPYVKPTLIVGSLWKVMLNAVHDIEVERYKEMGPVYGLFEGRRPALTMGDPDVLRDVFVKDFHYFTGRRSFASGGKSVNDLMVINLRGEHWKRVRTLITPTFTTGKMKRMANIFVDCAQNLCNNLKKISTEGKPVDMKKLYGALTMDVIASSAFGTKVDSHNDPSNPFAANARSVFSRNLSWRILVFVFTPWLYKKLRLSIFPPGPTNFFRDVTLKIIEERKRSGSRRNDFLQLLLDAEKEVEKEGFPKETDELSEVGHEENNDQVFKQIRGSKSLSNDEIVAQCVLFFFAGYDTTASAMSLATYELALNPDVQEKLISEIDEVISEKGGLTYEAIAQMKYLDYIVSETLRKYPPFVRGERVADEDYYIKKYDIEIPKGYLVGVPVYAMQHDPQHYPDPEKFDPERFTPEVKATRHPFTYLPFGAGPRNCVAMRFALLEIKIALACIFSQFRFRRCTETQVPPRYFTGQAVLIPRDVTLKAEIRTDAVNI